MRNYKGFPSVPSSSFVKKGSDYLESIAKSPLDAQVAVQSMGEGPCNSLYYPASEESKCGRFALLGECVDGHKYAKSLDCNKEWCGVCKDSAHGRRIARWLPKAQKIGVMGYLVVTFPEDKRPRDKKRLSWAAIQITRGLRRQGIRRGLRRWHYFGDKSDLWNPHINFLLDSGYLSPHQLIKMKKMIRGVLGIPEAVINYQFTREKKKIIHWLSYVTRPTFLKREWDEQMADELYNFRNAASFGKWLDENKWEISKKEEILGYYSKIANSICPICGKEIHWHGLAKKEDLAELGYEQIWKKIWQVDAPADKVLAFDFLKDLQRRFRLDQLSTPSVPSGKKIDEADLFGVSLGRGAKPLFQGPCSMYDMNT